MPDTLVIKKITGATVSRELAQERIVERYEVHYEGSPVTLVSSAYTRALAVGLPTRTTRYQGTSLYFDSAVPTISESNRNVWYWDVTWTPLPTGTSADTFNENPLLRPPVFDLQRRETDFPIVVGRNVEQLDRADGGSQRAADTLGRIVNAAGEQPDEQPLDTVSNPVIIIHRNFSSLAEINSLNLTYQLSTNSVPVSGWSVRRLKFLAAESLGRREENNVTYYPCEIRIEVMPTTELRIDNVGFNHWKNDKLTRATVSDDNGNVADSASPINLNLDGTEGSDDSPTSIGWRYLNELDYNDLFN